MIVRVLLVFLLVSLAGTLTGADTLPAIGEAQNIAQVQYDCLYYFYGEGCKDCDALSPFMEKLQHQYPQLELKQLDVYIERDNYHLLQKYFTAYNVPQESQGVPIVFAEDSYLAGKEAITALLEERIRNGEGSCPSLTPGAVVGVAGRTATADVFQTLTFLSVTGAGLRDAYHRGALAMLIVLLLGMLVIGKGDQMLKKGLVFIIAVYLSYFLFSIGLFSFIFASRFGFFLAKSIGLASVILAFLGIKGFFSTWQSMFRESFKDIKGKWEKVLNVVVSSPAIFLAGVITAFMTFGEAGHTFLSMRALLGDNLTSWQVWPMALYYIFLFMLHPLAVILFLYFARQRMGEAAEVKAKGTIHSREKWEAHINKVINFIISVVVLVLGVIVVFL